jgi:hypothetical protein
MKLKQYQRLLNIFISQTGRDFKNRYTEHVNDIKTNKDKYRYAVQILQENHEYSPIDKIINILKLQNKGKHLDVHERFHIYKINKQKSYK